MAALFHAIGGSGRSWCIKRIVGPQPMHPEMIEREMGSIPARVGRGVAVLDREKPGWEYGIDLEKLDMRDSCDCILGQLYGSFGWGMDYLFDLNTAGNLHESAREHGFGFVPRREHYFLALEAEWTRRIERLRDMT